MNNRPVKRQQSGAYRLGYELGREDNQTLRQTKRRREVHQKGDEIIIIEEEIIEEVEFWR